LEPTIVGCSTNEFNGMSPGLFPDKGIMPYGDGSMRQKKTKLISWSRVKRQPLRTASRLPLSPQRWQLAKAAP
jgi:hypothetical protein